MNDQLVPAMGRVSLFLMAMFVMFWPLAVNEIYTAMRRVVFLTMCAWAVVVCLLGLLAIETLRLGALISGTTTPRKPLRWIVGAVDWAYGQAMRAK